MHVYPESESSWLLFEDSHLASGFSTVFRGVQELQ